MLIFIQEQIVCAISCSFYRPKLKAAFSDPGQTLIRKSPLSNLMQKIVVDGLKHGFQHFLPSLYLRVTPPSNSGFDSISLNLVWQLALINRMQQKFLAHINSLLLQNPEPQFQQPDCPSWRESGPASLQHSGHPSSGPRCDSEASLDIQPQPSSRLNEPHEEDPANTL